MIVLKIITSTIEASDTDKAKPAALYEDGRASNAASTMFSATVKIDTNSGVLVSFWA